MDALEGFLRSFRGAHGIQIFLVAFIVVFIKVSLKYAIKMDVFKASAKPDPTIRRATHFDCLRVGMDLAHHGIVCFVSVLRVSLSTLSADSARLAALGNLQPTLLLSQILLLLLATISTGIFDSAEKTYEKGIAVPGFLGFLSIVISVAAFFFVSRGV